MLDAHTAKEKVDKTNEGGKVLAFKAPAAEPQGVENRRRYSLSAFKLSDIEDCVEAGKMMHQESAFRPIKFSENKVRDFLTSAYHNADMYYGVVARDQSTNRLIGFGLFYITPYYFSHETAVYDMCSFVAPEWRGSTIFVRVISHALNWAIDKGATEFVIGTTTEVDTAKVEKMFERMGLTRVGAVFKQRLKRV